LRSEAEEQTYSYFNKENCEKLVIYKVTEEPVAQLCKDISMKCWNVLNCRDGGRIDLKVNANNIPNFLEVNPLAGLNPLHSDLPILAKQKGLEYKDLIKMIMDSAVKRIKK
jgi:D-alanine-D-alanine ligase